MNEPSRPATLGRAVVRSMGRAALGGCGGVVLGLVGAADIGLCTVGDGGFASFGGNGSPPTAAASVPRGGFGGGVRDAGWGRSLFVIA